MDLVPSARETKLALETVRGFRLCKFNVVSRASHIYTNLDRIQLARCDEEGFAYNCQKEFSLALRLSAGPSWISSCTENIRSAVSQQHGRIPSDCAFQTFSTTVGTALIQPRPPIAVNCLEITPTYPIWPLK